MVLRFPEKFLSAAGEMVVDYAANGHARRIRLPAMGPEEGRSVISAKAVDDFLLKLLPLSMFLSPSTRTSQYPNVCRAKHELQ